MPEPLTEMRPLTLCALALALYGCDVTGPPEAGELALTVSGTGFEVGTEIAALVENETDRTLWLYDCGEGRISLHIQEQQGAEWETVALVNGDCGYDTFMVPYRLDADQEQTVTFDVERPGTYRLQTYFGTVPGSGTDVGRADWVEAVSETFVVTAL